MVTSYDDETPDLNISDSVMRFSSRRLPVISRCTSEQVPLKVAHLINARPLENALDRAKDLIPSNGHVIGHVAKDGRLHKVALLTYATQLPSLLLSCIC